MSRTARLGWILLGLALAALPFLHFIAGHDAGHGGHDVASHAH